MCMQKADQVGKGGGYHLLGDQKNSSSNGAVFWGETILRGLVEIGQVCVCVFCGWTDQKSRSISDPHQTLKIKPWLVSQPAYKSICSDVKICLESTSLPSEATPKLNILGQNVAACGVSR